MTNKLNNLIIFEMANSHQGSLEHGIHIIQEMGKIARKHNLNAAVKLQYRDLDTFIHPDYKGRTDVPHIPRFESTRLNYEQFCELVAAIKREGLVAISTPFDETGVGWCCDQGLDIIKIASCSSSDWPLLEEAAKCQKPLIISTGGKTISDIDNIYNFCTHRNCEFALMHCVAEYPAPTECLQLDFIDKLKKRYPEINIGYSGHEDPNDTAIPMMAVAKGANIFERHVGLPTDTIQLNAYSMNPQQAEKWAVSIKEAQQICSLRKEDDRWISQEEIDSLNSLARGCYARHEIQEGESITQDKVFFAMPCQDGQTTSGQFKSEMIASRDYHTNDAIYEEIPLTNISIAREVIHEAKGLLLESGIRIGNDFEVELSHHYGIEHFRKTGATIITIINREYCKKLVLVLPGQSHPNHFHKIKEETFQLLYGDLNITVDGVARNMCPGDTQTILRNSMHEFSSINGAIFEEISTTHIKGDSYYEDEAISKKDLMERKTFLEDW